MDGALLVTGTGSDAGKSVFVAGLCRHLARKGVRVAPFKAQNMSLNSAVTADGGEIGRAQAMQAAAAGIVPEVAMNPVLLKPNSDRGSQVIVMGEATGDTDAVAYQEHKAGLLDVVSGALADLQFRHDVVICEGAGSPAEINLRSHDLVNMGLARTAGLPTVLLGDIDRGGVFAALYGTLALLEPGDQALVAGFVINKFRGDVAMLDPGLDQLAALTGRPTLGVLPWIDGLWIDVEDSLGLDGPRPEPQPPVGAEGLDVAVVRLPQLSNFTDMDPLAAEPGVRVTFTDRPHDVARADLVILPGTKATVADLTWVRRRHIDGALIDRAARGAPILGICGGYQMLGHTIDDRVESRAGQVDGLNLLPVGTVFADRKVLARPSGSSPVFDGVAASGYEIHHGRSTVSGGTPLLRTLSGIEEGCMSAAVMGTAWHGLLESDGFRRALLSWVARATGRHFVAAEVTFAAVRDAQLDRLGDLVGDHVDGGALEALIGRGVPAGLPVIAPAGAVHP